MPGIVTAKAFSLFIVVPSENPNTVLIVYVLVSEALHALLGNANQCAFAVVEEAVGETKLTCGLFPAPVGDVCGMV